jgi:hypothetical protein
MINKRTIAEYLHYTIKSGERSLRDLPAAGVERTCRSINMQDNCFSRSGVEIEMPKGMSCTAAGFI